MSPTPAGGAAARVVVWIDGALADPTTASVHWSDHGLTVGDGVFETIELRAGAPFALTRHLARLTRSATGLGLTPPAHDGIEHAVREVVAAWGEDPGRLRITLTAGPGPMGSGRGDGPPTLVVAATAMTIATEPTDVLVVEATRNERGALVGLKTTSYAENVVALAAAARLSCSEALFANTRDELCEGTGSNVVVGIDGALVTPPLDSGCLAGVTRALLLEALERAGTPAVEAPLPMSELHRADELFLISTARHLQPVRRVLDAQRGDLELSPAPGPLTRHAAAVWRAATADTIDP